MAFRKRLKEQNMHSMNEFCVYLKDVERVDCQKMKPKQGIPANTAYAVLVV